MKHIVLIFSIIVFFIAGCAHNSGRDLSPDAVTEPTHLEAASKAESKDLGPDRSALEKKNHQAGAPDFLDDTEAGKKFAVADPIYPWNVAMFHFNDRLYFWVIKPLATGYKVITPSPVRVGVKNFFQNVTTPVRLVNSLLQWKLRGAMNEVTRFFVNTTAGLFGFVDVAEARLNIKPSDEDLGQTLGSYGMGNGIYIVWPLIGPSTLRDTFGDIGDFFLDPVHYVEPSYLSAGISGYRTLNDTSLRLGEYEDFKESAFDPYISLKDGYIQRRQSKVKK